jgi:hypothetical protein
MATIKITALGHLSNADIAPGDVFVIDDVSATTTKKLTVANLTSYVSTTLGNLEIYASYANSNAAALSSSQSSIINSVNLVSANVANIINGTTTFTNNVSVANGIAPTALYLYNSYTDASNYERGKVGWASNTFEISTEAIGTGTRRAIKLNYTTTIDGFARTNVPALTVANVGAGTGGLVIGALAIGHRQDNARSTGLDIANKALLYSIRGSAVSSQGAHRFSGDNNTGTSVGANGSIVDIIAPSTATNILQGRKADETVVFNVGYDGSVTIAGNLNFIGYNISERVTNNVSSLGADVFSMPIASKHFAKLLINVEDLTYGQYQTSELLLIQDGTDSKLTEYGIVFTSTNPIVSYDSYLDASNVVIRATATSSDNRIRVLQITS